MTVLFIVFALALAACSSQESITAPVQYHPQAAKSGEAALSEGSVETDRAVLVAFYLAITSSRTWDNWLCEAPLDQWAGVSTDENGRVRGLDLNGDVQYDEHKLRGFIPSELAQLDNLHYLDLGDNELRGFIPPELGNLKNLHYLDLSDNELRGELPLELGQLDSLQYLDLFLNELCGPIPPELGNLGSLQYLSFQGNELSGPIPPELGNLKNLQTLNLFVSGVSGPIPPELGNLSSLQRLDLQRNQLSGSIPPELGNLGSLQDLELSENQLSGPIPPELGNLKNLQRLDLGGNQLSGPIPPELAQLDSLRYLNLGGNQLSGPIPPELAQLDSLQYLFLGGNQLSGCIPPALFDIERHSLGGTGLFACFDYTDIDLVALYAAMVPSFEQGFFVTLNPAERPPGDVLGWIGGPGGGAVEITSNNWTFQDYSPDGELRINGTLSVGIDWMSMSTPLTGTVALTPSGSNPVKPVELIFNMVISFEDEGFSFSGTLTINGAEFDVAELSAAAAEASG